MKESDTTLSHEEISLLLFALEGGTEAKVPDLSTCEDACPVVESVEDLLCGGKLEPRQQLVRHLNNHVREALIETGMFELMGSPGEPSSDLTPDHKSRLDLANRRLSQWSSTIKLSDHEKQLLSQSLRRVPRSAWLIMPRTLWRLKRKLKPVHTKQE